MQGKPKSGIGVSVNKSCRSKWQMFFHVQPFMQTVRFPDGIDPNRCEVIMCNDEAIKEVTQLRAYEGRIYRLPPDPPKAEKTHAENVR